jgi:hypothetical protein
MLDPLHVTQCTAAAAAAAAAQHHEPLVAALQAPCTKGMMQPPLYSSTTHNMRIVCVVPVCHYMRRNVYGLCSARGIAPRLIIVYV